MQAIALKNVETVKDFNLTATMEIMSMAMDAHGTVKYSRVGLVAGVQALNPALVSRGLHKGLIFN